MKVTVQKVLNVESPTRAHATDAGLDLYVPEGQGCLVRCGAAYTIDLGIRVAIPDGYYGQLTLRSSAGMKGLSMPHGVGVIDADYRGNIKATVTALTEPTVISAGDRICQLIILPLPPVDVESGVVNDNTDRGKGGFGSTGRGVSARDHAPQKAGTLHGEGLTTDGKGNMEDQVYLTVGGLLRTLQDIAFRYGVDTPIVIPTLADADYEQATAPIVMHADREDVPGDWDLFHVAPTGEAVAVIS